MTAPRFAGMGAHHSHRAKTDTWLTPPEIIRALGPFDLDPCAAMEQPWRTAAVMFTKRENGLIQRWCGRVWLNPPYGDEIGRWLGRLVEHGNGTALIFARTETDVFFRLVWERAHALRFLRGRLNFYDAAGQRAPKNSGAPSVLVAYGDVDADRLGDAGELGGQFIVLRAAPRIVVLVPEDGKTWRMLLSEAVAREGAPVGLAQVYVLVAGHPKAARNPHWRDKVRQILQRPPFRRVGRGTYELAPQGPSTCGNEAGSLTK